jgi:hypothetical protein
LSRFPNQDEAADFEQVLASATSKEDQSLARSDLLWVLLNTAECAVCP